MRDFLRLVLVALLAAPAFGKIYRDTIKPQWSADSSHFWYRNDLAGGQREYVLVDAERGVRELAFDHAVLARAVNALGKGTVKAERLNLDQLRFDTAADLALFRYRGTHYSFHRQTHALTPIDAPEPQKAAPKPKIAKPKPRPRFRVSRSVSPDGKWRAYIEGHNVFVRPAKGEGDPIQLSSDGSEQRGYQSPYWSPNSNNLIAFRTQKGEVDEVHRIESSPEGGGRAKLHSQRYALPGDPFTTHELSGFDLQAKSQHKPEIGLIDFRGPQLRWSPDGRFVRFEKIDRGHQRLRIIEIDMLNGELRNLIDEQTDSFIWTEHMPNLGVPLVNWLKASDEIIYLSEQHGWWQLYLIDIATHAMTPITKGEFVVRRVDRVDEVRRQIWFRASGYYAGQDPYLLHHFRVNFDGSGFTALTAGDGDHEIRYSPDERFIIDSYSRIDMPPVHELRRVADGSLVCSLEKSDISELEASEDYVPTEVFVAKGRDGKTDIWGIISRPADLDPNKKYPVLEPIYAGPHGAFVPKRWSNGPRYRSWTDMGFVVANIDGMGTAHRSKAFHDVCWQNIKDAGLPDRILWHQAVAAKYPWYDISRVGIYGGSAGGQSSTGALLFHPDFYKVAVSSCGCHDNRMDKASWNEQWMGYPVGPQYAASSNIDNAHRLQGKLMLIVGEMDNNVPPESTLRLVDALIKAGKDFEFVFVPGEGHGGGGKYGDRRRKDFFREHLLGIPPPDRNASP